MDPWPKVLERDSHSGMGGADNGSGWSTLFRWNDAILGPSLTLAGTVRGPCGIMPHPVLGVRDINLRISHSQRYRYDPTKNRVASPVAATPTITATKASGILVFALPNQQRGWPQHLVTAVDNTSSALE